MAIRRTQETDPAVVTDEGGDAACWAHLVCPECGRVTESGVPHRCEGEEHERTPTTD